MLACLQRYFTLDDAPRRRAGDGWLMAISLARSVAIYRCSQEADACMWSMAGYVVEMSWWSISGGRRRQGGCLDGFHFQGHHGLVVVEGERWRTALASDTTARRGSALNLLASFWWVSCQISSSDSVSQAVYSASRDRLIARRMVLHYAAIHVAAVAGRYGRWQKDMNYRRIDRCKSSKSLHMHVRSIEFIGKTRSTTYSYGNASYSSSMS